MPLPTVRRRLGAVLGAGGLLVALAVAGAAPASAVTAPSTGCPQVEAIAVRASTEPQGGGSISGPMVQAVQSQSRQTVRTYNLVYPATLNNYSSSVRQGVSALQTRLRSTSSSCSSTAFVLVGYSQGSQVIADTLDTTPVPGASQVRAVVLHGDPTFNGSEAYDTGGYRPGRNGIFPRARGALADFASTIRSVCHATDNFCQSGASGNGHYTYASDRSAGVSFILGKIGS